ncbi:MAG TPA: hypothetical protein VM143_10200 [Acidimicrobiales bacterium]|nr:hypothetical protein [Acidimicrobiales bacterium]
MEGTDDDLAELSHLIDRVALSLCRDDPDDRRVELYLVQVSEGQSEATAVALSYALRRRELEGSTPLNDRAVAALAGAVRRLQRTRHGDEDPPF